MRFRLLYRALPGLWRAPVALDRPLATSRPVERIYLSGTSRSTAIGVSVLSATTLRECLSIPALTALESPGPMRPREAPPPGLTAPPTRRATRRPGTRPREQQRVRALCVSYRSHPGLSASGGEYLRGAA